MYIGEVNLKPAIIKFESPDSDQYAIEHEHQIYQLLGTAEGIPRCLHYGAKHGKRYLALDPAGIDLQRLQCLCGNRFSIGTVLHIAQQMVRTIHQVIVNRTMG